MKSYVLALLGAALAASSLAGDPVVGDERAQVIKRIGKPRGHMTMGERETLLYDRGAVELITGRVSKVTLVTPEELADLQTEREKQAQLAEEAYRARVAEGEKARTDLLADGTYKDATPAEKVAAWEKFRQAHPDVAPPAEYQQSVQAKQVSEQKAAAAAAIEAAKEEPAPRLSSSKKRKLRRTVMEEGAAPVGP